MTNEEIAHAAAELGIEAVTAAIAAYGGPLPLIHVARAVAMATVDAIAAGRLPMPAVTVTSGAIEIVDEIGDA